MGAGEKVIVTNRRAGRDFFVEDRFEAGIALQGTEVKALREPGGGLTLKDSYADIRKGEIFLVGAHINPYERGNIHNHKPERTRKLLMHKREIERLRAKVDEKGFTLIPLKVYFKRGMVKVQIGLCRGKKSFDKRDTIKERESKIEMDRAMKESNR